MSKQIILRLKSFEGLYRITVNTNYTYGEVLLDVHNIIFQISKKLGYSIKSFNVMNEKGIQFKVQQSAKISRIPYFIDGAIIKVQLKQPSKVSHTGIKTSQIEQNIGLFRNQKNELKCNHGLGGKCLNCIQIGQKSQKDTSQEQTQKSKCNHGPNGKCFNCITVNLKNLKQNLKMLCQHGQNAKCIHCLDKQFISDTAHISFDNWLQEKKLKCKGVHPLQVKCHNCLPPSKLRYEVDISCQAHQPYPKAMCNKCIPSSVVIKRQQYRHVDYVQFMNLNQIQNFVKYWIPRSHQQQRVAFLYGYYAEDPHYKGGIRVIVQALYEPPQIGTFGGFEILQSQLSLNLQSVVTGLTLQRVGWLFTQINHDVVMSEKYVKMAAKFQEQYKVPHQSGYDISNFITVILRTGQKNNDEVVPEVYMVSDQCQALQKVGLFIDSNSRSKMAVKPKEGNEAMPSFLCAGKPVTQFEPEFLLVKIAHGSSKTNKYSILKKGEFPVFHRDKPTLLRLREYLMKYRNLKPNWQKYADFNLLLYISDIIDPSTAYSICESIVKEEPINENIQLIVDQMSDL